jgi:hypothetical protein
MLLGASPPPHHNPEALHFIAFSCPYHPHRREIGLTEIQGEMGERCAEIAAEIGAEAVCQAQSREGPCWPLSEAVAECGRTQSWGRCLDSVCKRRIQLSQNSRWRIL